jgi:hypothetical protein
MRAPSPLGTGLSRRLPVVVVRVGAYDAAGQAFGGADHDSGDVREVQQPATLAESPGTDAVAVEARALRVSVVIPVFNCHRFVAEAVESILAQSLRDLELIVVDDGSTDGSGDIVAGLLHDDPRGRLLVNERNLGLSRTLNRGWQAARAPYIARLDADDVALPDRLSRQVSFLDAHPRVAAVGGSLIRIDESGAVGATVTFPTRNRGIRATLRRRSCIAHPAAVIRRSALENVGGYRLDEAEDFDLWLRLSDEWELANLREPVVLYREHPAQVTRATVERQMVATLAIHASAKARRAGRHDPLASAPAMSIDTLDQLRVDAAEVEDRVTRACLELAASSVLLGHHGESAALVEQARGGLGKRTDRAFAAAVALKRADAHLSARRPLAGLADVCAGIVHSPRYTSGRLLSRLRDLMNGRMLW